MDEKKGKNAARTTLREEKNPRMNNVRRLADMDAKAFARVLKNWLAGEDPKKK